MDEVYNRKHFKKSCLAPSFFPTVTLKLPLDQSRLQKIEDFAANKHCQFIGGRLKLLLSTTTERVPYPVMDNALRHVWKRVTQLTVVRETGIMPEMQEILELLAPYLRQMTNLVSFTCHLYMDVDLILCLPKPEKLEFIVTTNKDCVRRCSDDWAAVFQRCRGNLKIFSSRVLTRGIEIALLHVKFEQLEEIRLACHFLDILNEDELKSEYIEGLARRGMQLHFPKLKRLEIPFLLESGPWEFPRQLLSLTATIESIEELQINVAGWFYITIERHPIPREYFKTGSLSVRRLIINSWFHHQMMVWSLCFAELWPGLQSLKIGTHEFVKCESGWLEVYGGLVKCEECAYE